MPALKGFHAQPSGSMVCGAYALTAIFEAFGRLPAKGSTTLQYGGRKAIVFDKSSGLAAARNIYSVTGSGPKGNNMPAAMAYVVKQFGLKPTVGFAKGCPLLLHPQFGPLFAGEQSACQSLGAGGKEGLFSKPGKGSCQAVCVDNRMGGFHWLALGENDLYMDPGDGRLHGWSKVTGKYTPVGLWVSIEA